jgi:hypothetical protein
LDPLVDAVTMYKEREKELDENSEHLVRTRLAIGRKATLEGSD